MTGGQKKLTFGQLDRTDDVQLFGHHAMTAQDQDQILFSEIVLKKYNPQNRNCTKKIQSKDRDCTNKIHRISGSSVDCIATIQFIIRAWKHDHMHSCRIGRKGRGK